MALYKTGNPVPSSAMPDVWDNNRVQDEILNSEELEVETRTGIMTPTWKGVLKKNEDEIEETRRFDFTPALPVLFVWIEYTKRIHYLQYNTYTYFCFSR
ncbi:hypothetical protein ACS2GA_24255 (plasmid) [Klebsiella pneumoniae]|uniref:hypothetical protein n=1 Tax=Klebsiella pneumoniae TaxID=573 RepID=UPI003F6A6ED7